MKVSRTPGDDIVQGDSGDDVIYGDAGVNILTGGPGGDIFFCSPEEETTITDFVPRVDVIRGPCIVARDSAAPTADASTAEASMSLLQLPLPT
jgi:Ca2+-binding RTX toxin-like protein